MCWFADWLTLLSARCKYKMTTYLVLGVQYKYQNLCIGYQVLPKTIRANEISQLS